ncbi:methyltransferase [Rhodomicrobium lacus]|uniref:methyltransferase n=1 Tax=Rhodomicrobium lacus TaxID=2498452 RepID=UPI000F8D12F6|nr:methyltransferase [Rhodomicrobium lacus]
MQMEKQPIKVSGTETPPIKLIQQIIGYRTSQCIRVAVEFGIPAMLEHGAMSVDEIAQRAGVHEDLIGRILDHLASVEIIGKDDAGKYTKTSTSKFLVPGHDNSLCQWISCELHPLYWRSWEYINDQMRRGDTAFELAHGLPHFQYLANDFEAQVRFDEQMRGASMAMGAVVISHLEFQEGVTIVDVGGGDGSLLAQILERNPTAKGVLFDLPRKGSTLSSAFEKLRCEGRASIERGSFFEAIPPAGDIYIFSRVFHDFNDQAVKRILDNTRAVMRGGERLVIVDIMLDDTASTQRRSSQDVFMMVQLGGRERTFDDLSKMLSMSGFDTASFTKTETPLSILECSPQKR